MAAQRSYFWQSLKGGLPSSNALVMRPLKTPGVTNLSFSSSVKFFRYILTAQQQAESSLTTAFLDCRRDVMDGALTCSRTFPRQLALIPFSFEKKCPDREAVGACSAMVAACSNTDHRGRR